MTEPEIPTGPLPATTPEVGRADTTAPELPQQIGRYRVERLLGTGGFGRVYLAHDEQLHRPVAIKVPHQQRTSRPEDVEAYLAEARILASLDHPHIVPVFDVGTTEDGRCYVVSKLIEGSDLAKNIKPVRPSFTQAAALVATLAEALHYAHRKGLIHLGRVQYGSRFARRPFFRLTPMGFSPGENLLNGQSREIHPVSHPTLCFEQPRQGGAAGQAAESIPQGIVHV